MISPVRSGVWLTLLLILILQSHSFGQGQEAGRDEYLYAQRLYDEGYYDLAAEQLERVLQDHPGMAGADEAQFLLGETYVLLGEFNKARSAFLRTAVIYPEFPRAPEAMYKVGESLERLGRPVDAAQSYKRVFGFYPKDVHAPLGLKAAAGIYILLKDSLRAEETYAILIEEYPLSEAADDARLYQVKRLIGRGEKLLAERYLRRIAERSGREEMAARAWLELGRFLREEWRFDAAIEALTATFDRYPTSRSAISARIELADLFTFRGLTDRALEAIQPLLKNVPDSVRALASIKAGDAYYRCGEFDEALKLYKSAETLPQGLLKAAWTSEKSGRIQQAFDKYNILAASGELEANQAALRAAKLTENLGLAEEAVVLWRQVVSDTAGVDSTGRSWYELFTALYHTQSDEIDLVSAHFVSHFPESPWLDEALYLTAKSRYERGKYSDAVAGFSLVVERCQSSGYADSALVYSDFIRRYHIRSESLVDRMADLSASPAGSGNSVQRTLDWGDFYLNEFKDPVRAVDQFDRVIEDIIASTDGRNYALFRSGQAFLLMYQAALLERDQISVQMYGDSTHSRLSQLQQMAPNTKMSHSLASDILFTELFLLNDGSTGRQTAFQGGGVYTVEYGFEKLSPDAVAQYIETGLNYGEWDSAGAEEIKTILDEAVSGCSAGRTIAGLKLQRIRAMELTGDDRNAIDSAFALIETHKAVPAGARAFLWLIRNDLVTPESRLDLLERYQQEYPYLVDEIFAERLRATLLDSLGKPFEALKAEQRLESALTWSVPRLDILHIPDELTLYRQAQAFHWSGVLARAMDEYRMLLNLAPQSEYAPQSLLSMAKIHRQLGNYSTALAYIDTLDSRFPFAEASSESIYLKPELYFRVGDFNAAREIFLSLASRETNPDSLFHYRLEAVVCLYRTGRLDEARNSAKELYKEFEDRDDLDNAKALFYLEKGRAFERSKQYDEARKQYEVIKDKFTLTDWVDDAEYSTGLSLVDQGRYKEGAASLSAFLDNYPQSDLVLNARYALGMAQFRAENYSDALKPLKLLWMDDSARGLWLPVFEVLISIYKDLHFFDAAISLTRAYLERFPGVPDEFIRRLDIGQFYLHMNEWDEAVRHYTPLLSVADAESEAEIQYYIGEAFMGKGDYQTAILEFLKVKVLGSRTKLDWAVTALYKSGECYEKLDDREGATRMYKQIIAEHGEASNFGRAARKKLDELPTIK